MLTNVIYSGYSLHNNPIPLAQRDTALTYLLRLQTSGKCEVVFNNNKFTIQKGDFFLIRPGDTFEQIVNVNNIPSHTNLQSEDFHIVCEGAWIEEWLLDKSGKQPIHLNQFEEIIQTWKILIRESKQLSNKGNNELTSGLLKVICLLIEREINDESSAHAIPYIVKKMTTYIELHAIEGLKIQEVADSIGLSVSRASFLFKKHVGMTMLDYSLEVRLNHALEMMKFTNESLEVISENCGFNTYSYFHKVFKKKYSNSPGEYRKRENDIYYLL